MLRCAQQLTSLRQSVMPPPPRYPIESSFKAGAGGGAALPLIETNNTIANPEGPEYQLLVGEGLSD